MVKILDCTFRDGGYYNAWDFDIPLFKRYLELVSSSGIYAIEVGFRFFPKEKDFGSFAYTTDDFLSEFSFPNIIIAVMVNSKELVNYSKGPRKAVGELFVEKKNSPVDMVRIAVNINDVEQSQSIAYSLKEKGYFVGCNLMQSANKTSEEIKKAVSQVDLWNCVDVLYFADSLGSMNGDEIKNIVKTCNDYWGKDVGFHGHDNKGRALDNSLTAYEEGVKWIDGTILGMGRGAGNTRMEYLLVEFKKIGLSHINPVPIFSLVFNEFEHLKNKYNWGSNLFYFLSACYQIHPTYIQELLSSIIYSKEEILSVIENLSKSKQANSYSQDRLRGAMVNNKVTARISDSSIRVNIIIPARYQCSRFPGKALVELEGKTLIQRVWERCCLALPESCVYVATDNESIKSHCEELGIQTIMTTSDCLTGTDRVYQCSLNLDADLFVNVQGDEPLVSPDDIIKVINAHVNSLDKVHCGMCPIIREDDFRRSSVPKVVTKLDNTLLYISRAPIPTNKDLDFVGSKKQVCIYAFPKKALKDFGEYGKKGRLEEIEDIEILRFFELGYEIEMVDVSDSSMAVDYPEDVDRVIKAIREYESIFN